MSISLLPLIPLLGSVLAVFADRAGRNACALVTGGVTLAALLLLLTVAPAVYRGEVVGTRFEWLPQVGLTYSVFVDGLGLFFAAIILVIGLLITAYARSYLGPEEPAGRFFAYLLLFQGAMVGIVVSDNILLLAIFWELTSLSSFLLIGSGATFPRAGRVPEWLSS